MSSNGLINIEFDGVDNFRKVIDEDQRDLDDEINKMKDQINRLQAIWKGQDSDIFCKHMNFYLDRMTGLPVCMRNISSFVKHISGNFKTYDASFARKLSTENRYDDDYKKTAFKSDGFDMNGKKKNKGVSA